MFDYSVLPHLNALLNTASVLLLAAGFASIRRRNKRLHRIFMLAAVTVSGVFLISYLTYHAQEETLRMQRQGWIRHVYFAILISHSVLAASLLPLVALSLTHAFRGRFGQHRRTARWTFPIWIYVSITGVLVYLILYRI
ncbi:MAG: DUF420 domain-containing protein [Acidobacteria bacterium]|nr:DUF420 domain-containing protein [Acidobacteriota bacterium]